MRQALMLLLTIVTLAGLYYTYNWSQVDLPLAQFFMVVSLSIAVIAQSAAFALARLGKLEELASAAFDKATQARHEAEK